MAQDTQTDTESTIGASSAESAVLTDGLGVEYKCGCCGGVFTTAWTQEEALNEKESNGWGDMNKDDMVVVCDGCYKDLMAFNEPLTPNETELTGAR
jgi:hypothetical protein